MLSDTQEKIIISKPVITWCDGDALDEDRVLLSITVGDVQEEAMERLGRKLTVEEIAIAKKGLESGLLTDISSVYYAILQWEINDESVQ